MKVGDLQFLETAAFARSIESPSKDDKFATSYGPLSSFAVGAALAIIIFFPRVQSTNNCKFKGYIAYHSKNMEINCLECKIYANSLNYYHPKYKHITQGELYW